MSVTKDKTADPKLRFSLAFCESLWGETDRECWLYPAPTSLTQSTPVFAKIAKWIGVFHSKNKYLYKCNIHRTVEVLSGQEGEG